VKHPCSRLLAAGCAGFLSLACFGQTLPSFFSTVSPSGPLPSHLYAVDVNNDGLTDIIQDSASPGETGAYFSISINNGDGTFQPPVNYSINSNTWTPLTWGDFNNDGNVDIAVMLPGTNQIAVYLGNGNGTFQSPITTPVDLPSGMTFGGVFPGYKLVAADFNHDGNLDLVTPVYNGNDFGGVWEVYLLEGDGTGHFTNPTSIYQPTAGWTVQGLVTGDFDTDGNADVGVLEEMTCSSGIGYCWSNVVALFGNGDLTFDPIDVTYVANTQMTLGSADLNNDGATDLYGMQYSTTNQSSQLAVFLGHYDRKFSYYYTPIPDYQGDPQYVSAPFAVADFDGTQSWALAAVSTTTSTQSTVVQMIYFLNAGDENPSILLGPSPAGNSGSIDSQIGPVVGNFNGDLKPDIALYSTTPAPTLVAGLNVNSGGFYGNCSLPLSGQGIHLCSPSTTGTITGTVNFAASANSFGQLRKIELWVDGVKLGEQHWIWGQSGYFDMSDSNLSPGTHYGTIYAANIDNTLQRYDFTFTTGNP
jgi:hypothetical protein